MSRTVEEEKTVRAGGNGQVVEGSVSRPPAFWQTGQ